MCYFLPRERAEVCLLRGNRTVQENNPSRISLFNDEWVIPQANGMIMPDPCFVVADASKAVFVMKSMPLEASVLNTTVIASSMPCNGRR